MSKHRVSGSEHSLTRSDRILSGWAAAPILLGSVAQFQAPTSPLSGQKWKGRRNLLFWEVSGVIVLKTCSLLDTRVAPSLLPRVRMENRDEG